MPVDSATDAPIERHSGSASLPTALQAANICAILTQATVLLETPESIGNVPNLVTMSVFFDF